ncbi:MAG: fumarylacetoacetate hydrolase family protein [Hyphomicrobiales bacterium]|nr:fumarylacetoacetate hydrolase family protein [Hyphomicrobiales bacterium]
MASEYLFPPQPQAALAVVGEDRLFPVARIFCVGRNYVEHAKEMGNEVDREAPFYFLKPTIGMAHSGATAPYALGTRDLHHEMELVVAIGEPAFRIGAEQAQSVVYGYACGLDMTRRDLQQDGKDKRRPWDFGKAFENGAVLGPITPAASVPSLDGRSIALKVNGVPRQSALLDDLVWKVDELISHLSRYYHLMPGDLIFTGTPAGVGPVVVGDVLEGAIDGLEPVKLTIGPAE